MNYLITKLCHLVTLLCLGLAILMPHRLANAVNYDNCNNRPYLQSLDHKCTTLWTDTAVHNESEVRRCHYQTQLQHLWRYSEAFVPQVNVCNYFTCDTSEGPLLSSCAPKYSGLLLFLELLYNGPYYICHQHTQSYVLLPMRTSIELKWPSSHMAIINHSPFSVSGAQTPFYWCQNQVWHHGSCREFLQLQFPWHQCHQVNSVWSNIMPQNLSAKYTILPKSSSGKSKDTANM